MSKASTAVTVIIIKCYEQCFVVICDTANFVIANSPSEKFRFLGADKHTVVPSALRVFTNNSTQ